MSFEKLHSHEDPKYINIWEEANWAQVDNKNQLPSIEPKKSDDTKQIASLDDQKPPTKLPESQKYAINLEFKNFELKDPQWASIRSQWPEAIAQAESEVQREVATC